MKAEANSENYLRSCVRLYSSNLVISDLLVALHEQVGGDLAFARYRSRPAHTGTCNFIVSFFLHRQILCRGLCQSCIELCVVPRTLFTKYVPRQWNTPNFRPQYDYVPRHLNTPRTSQASRNLLNLTASALTNRGLVE